MRMLLLLSVSIALLCGAANAQPQGKVPPRTGVPQQQKDQDRAREMQKDMDKKRDRTHKMDGVYGNQLLTEQERLRFREQMQQASTDEERQRIATQHREMIMQRAEERGMDLDNRPLFGRQLMTREERTQYREQIMNAESDVERQRIRETHRNLMLERARERKVKLDDDKGK